MSKEESRGFGTDYNNDPMPPIYHDLNRIHEVANWPQAMLEERMAEYTKFLQRPDIMPRAQQASLKLLGLMAFEHSYRFSQLDFAAMKELDESCTGTR